MAATEAETIANGLPALILAGEDHAHPSPLAFSERVEQKALIEVGSRPMIHWTLDAVRDCPRTGEIVVVGFESLTVGLGADILQLSGTGDLAENVLAGLRMIAARYGESTPVLVTGCDAPLIVPEALTWFVDACGDCSQDLYLAVVRQETLEAIYPRSRRSWFRTREGRFCSSDLALIKPASLLANQILVCELVAGRRDLSKVQHRLSSTIGWRALVGRIRMQEAREAVQQLTGLQIGIVELPFASMAMDVDTLEDLAAVRNEIAQQRIVRTS